MQPPFLSSIRAGTADVFFVGGLGRKARMTAIQTRVDELQLQVNEDCKARVGLNSGSGFGVFY